MNIAVLGGAGFIGTNLVMELAKNYHNKLLLVDEKKDYFRHIFDMNIENVSFLESDFLVDTDFDSMLFGQEIVYHLVSTTVPATSNKQISKELEENVLMTSKLLEACVRQNIKKVIFVSSGGTVYGKESNCPLSEDAPTNPITSYGVQKLTIEKLLYLYNHMYGLDYRIIRLANPYGPYQRPNGMLGAVTTFIYKALKEESITVYGDGTVVRDFIYIDDAIKGILKIANSTGRHKLYNLGSGVGTSINELLRQIQKELQIELQIEYVDKRDVDVRENYLDMSRYIQEFGKWSPISLEEGVRKTALFLSQKKVER